MKKQMYNKHRITLEIEKGGFNKSAEVNLQCTVYVRAKIKSELIQNPIRNLVILRSEVTYGWGKLLPSKHTSYDSYIKTKERRCLGRTFVEAYTRALEYCKKQIAHIETVFAELKTEKILAEIDDPFQNTENILEKVKDFTKNKKHYLYLQRKIEKWEKEEK